MLRKSKGKNAITGVDYEMTQQTCWITTPEGIKIRITRGVVLGVGSNTVVAVFPNNDDAKVVRVCVESSPLGFHANDVTIKVGR